MDAGVDTDRVPPGSDPMAPFDRPLSNTPLGFSGRSDALRIVHAIAAGESQLR